MPILYPVTDPCTYCNNRYGYGVDPDGICPICERNYRKENEKTSTKEQNMTDPMPLKNPTNEDLQPPKRRSKEDPLKAAQKQLKLSQKLSEAIVNYVAQEDYQGGPDLEDLREIYDKLAAEQGHLNNLIHGEL